jgi:ATP adenylyltransferase
MDFITGKREDGCIFCKKPPERDRARENLILHVGKTAFVILNRFPYHSAHTMVIPLRHTCDFRDLTPEENAEMSTLIQVTLDALKREYRPEGFNLGMNLGQCAGAGIKDHLHWHVVPRWIGDTNFFPLLAETRSMPELLSRTFERLRPAFETYERVASAEETR